MRLVWKFQNNVYESFSDAILAKRLYGGDFYNDKDKSPSFGIDPLVFIECDSKPSAYDELERNEVI